MKAYSIDLRRKIVDAIGRGMPKAEAARTFGIGISTVKRYATKARRGEPLQPGKAPGKRPKMDERVGKLLEEDLKERPFACLGGWVFVGYVDEDGEEREAAYRCRRCADGPCGQ
jgi:transposase